MMAKNVIHLWREHPEAPYQRWAMDLKPDPQQEHGYEIVDYDPREADTGFLARLNHEVSRSRSRLTGTTTESGGEVVSSTKQEILHPKDPGHLLIALRTLSFASVKNEGR